MSIITKLLALVRSSGIVGWFKGEVDKALVASADTVAKKYGDAAVQLCRDVDAALSNSAKLFAVATDLVTLVAKDGPQVPFAVAVIVAERAYAQVKADALTELRAFLAIAKG